MSELDGDRKALADATRWEDTPFFGVDTPESGWVPLKVRVWFEGQAMVWESPQICLCPRARRVPDARLLERPIELAAGEETYRPIKLEPHRGDLGVIRR